MPEMRPGNVARGAQEPRLLREMRLHGVREENRNEAGASGTASCEEIDSSMDTMICPRCNSRNFSVFPMTTGEGATPPVYECNDCGYVGIMVLIDSEAAKKLKVKKIKR